MIGLEISDFDKIPLFHFVDVAREIGLAASYDDRDADEGIMDVAVENWVTLDDTMTSFRVFKLGQKWERGAEQRWIFQLYIADAEGDNLTDRGCVWGSSNMEGLTLAVQEVDNRFTGMTYTLEEAVNARV